MLLRRSLSAATAAAASAAGSSAAASSSSAFPPPSLASSRPSALLEAYVNQPPPPAPRPDDAWRRDMFSVMAFSPQRKCAVTNARLPSAFMVNFREVKDGKKSIVVPDRLEHPKFKRRLPGHSIWAALHRDAVESLQSPKGTHVGFLRRIWGNAKLDKDATRIVEEGLLERTIQEATLLAEALGDKGQRHILPLSEVERDGSYLQPTRDGQVVAVLDLRPSAEPSEGKLDRGLAPLVVADLDRLGDGMLKRHDAMPTIPLFRIQEEYGERADELTQLLRSVVDADVLVLQSPEGEALTVPLAVALWRRLLFTGRGWKTAPKSK